MKFDCTTLVLDLDGTISDPSVGITRCFNHALQIHGFPEVAEDVIAREIGPPLDESFMKLAIGIVPSEVGQLISTYRERYSDTGFSENTMYADMPATLVRLRESGINLGVCTSKRRDFAEKILALFGLAEHFSFVSGGDVGITKGCQLAQLKNTQTIDDKAVMVGDRAVDIKAAKENGLRSVGVLWGFGDYAELSAASPSYIVEKVSELATIVI
ncbi:MAG: HAD-IA family hydrolase [Pseudomonadales bacterium]